MCSNNINVWCATAVIMIQTFFSAVFLSSTINKLCPKLNYITIFCCHLEFDSIEALTASFADAKKLPVLHACGKNMLLVQSKAQAMIATWCYQPDLEKPCSFSYLSRRRYVTFLTSSQESYHYIEWDRLIITCIIILSFKQEGWTEIWKKWEHS